MSRAGCVCGLHGLDRRSFLKAGAAATAIGALKLAADSTRPALAQGAKSKVVDIHAHYYPRPYLEVLAEESRRASTTYYRGSPEGIYLYVQANLAGPFPWKFADLPERLQEMDQQGVTVHALSLIHSTLYTVPPDASHRLATAFNDSCSAAHLAYQDRFVGLMALPMLDPDRAVEELNRASKLPGIRGVYMGTAIEDRDLDDAMFAPIFARIEQLGLPVFLHPMKTIPSKRLSAFYLTNLIGNPLDSAVAAGHLIFGGVLDRFPKLEINLPHAGGVLPILFGRWDHAYKVRKELKHLPRPPSAYLRRFTFDTVSHSAENLTFLISKVGADRVMVGSDYCFDMGYERPLDIVQELKLSPQDREMVLGGTAARLLAL